MKTNLKSGNAIVRLLLSHGEKIGIAAVGVCTALVIWSALGRERLSREPSDLDNLAEQARARVASFTWDALSEEDKKIAEPTPEAAMAKIQPLSFPNYHRPFNPPVSDPVTLRTDPVLLPPEDLEVNADSGILASASPAVIKRKRIELLKEEELKEQKREDARSRSSRDSGRGGSRRGAQGGEGYGGRTGPGSTRGGRRSKDAPIVIRPREGVQLQGFEEITAKSWVTVLAKVAIDQQTQLYFEALRTSRGYNKKVDIPSYVAYQIDRAEVTSKGTGEWGIVATIKSEVLLNEIATYPVNVPDIIDPDVKHPLLTHPLPPLILREWDERVSHSSMPLAKEKARLEAEAAREPEEVEVPAEGGGEEDLFAESETERGGRRPGSRGSRGGKYRAQGGFGRGIDGEYGGEGGGYGGEGGGYGGEGGGYGGEGGGLGGRGGSYGGSPGRGSDVKLAEFIWDQETSHILFRFFDNTVEPGHSYRYRVRLAMRDVNHNVKEQYLDKAVSQRREKRSKKQKTYRLTDWSEPSPVASVPLPARIYLISAKPARESSYTAEPEVEILIKALNSEFAAEVGRDDSFSRGSVISLSEKAKVVWANKFDELNVPSFKFMTGITVLNFTGGEKLGKGMLMPARALLMDAAGHLFVQEEMDDLETVEEYQTILKEGEKNRSRGGGRGRGGGGGGGGGGGQGEGLGGYGDEFGG